MDQCLLGTVDTPKYQHTTNLAGKACLVGKGGDSGQNQAWGGNVQGVQDRQVGEVPQMGVVPLLQQTGLVLVV